MTNNRAKLLVEVGDFISKDSLSFIDFNHFNGGQIAYAQFEVGNFQLLDYYQYSTSDAYVQGHYEHHFNKIEKLSIDLQPVISANYLYTQNDGHYWELGLGIGELFGDWRYGFYSSWRDGVHQAVGFRFGYVLNN